MNNNKNPFFSVIIPTYNRAHIILKILNSLNKQSFKDFEIIIVDNFSSDNIKQVLQRFIDNKEITFIQHKKNYERAKSRNTGLENANGEYATLLDSDDTVFPCFLEQAYKFIKANKNAKVFHSLYNIIDEKGKLYYKIKFPKISNNVSHIVNGNYLSCHAVFLHNEVYKSFKMDTNPFLTGYEDYEYWLRVLAHYKLFRLNEYNSAMIQHSGRSISSFSADLSIKQGEYIISKFKKDKNLNNVYKKYFKRLNATFYLYCSVQSNMRANYTKALKFLTKAIYCDVSIIFKLRFMRTLQISLFRIKIS